MFTKEERSSFPYWFAHWCAFNMTALLLHRWKLKYLLHDIEKPFLRLFLPYKTVQKIHRKHNRHHIEYWNPNRIDWEAMVIDNECSRLTKESSPLTCIEYCAWYERKKLPRYELMGRLRYAALEMGLKN